MRFSTRQLLIATTVVALALGGLAAVGRDFSESLFISFAAAAVVLIVLGLPALLLVVLFNWLFFRQPLKSKPGLFFDAVIVVAASLALFIGLTLAFL